MARGRSPSTRFEALTSEQRETLLRLDFASFVSVMYPEVHQGEALHWHAYLSLICSRLEDIAHGRRRNLIITLPPRHLKSFCVSVALPAFILGHYPGQDIMCVSYGQELAKEFARDCQTIMQSVLYRRLFGEVLLRARQPLATLRTCKGGIRRATSLDGVATGVGGACIIFDDPQKPGETLSETIRRASNETFRNTFFSRGTNPSTVRRVIVMQRLHEDDFVGHVLGLDGIEWEVLNLPAIAEEAQEIPYDTVFGPRAYRRGEGEPLHAGRIPLEEYEKIRRTLGEAVWAAQYQQRPAPMGGGLVKTAWFKRYGEAELPTEFDRIIQSWDTANTSTDWSDYSVCTTWGVRGKHAWLLHLFRQRLIYPDLKRAVLAQAALHDATAIFVEDHASGTQLLQELRADGFGKLRPVKPTRDKATRMINQTALIENGFVHVPAEAPWLEDYLYELAVFPNGKYDDQVDSTSQALEGMNSWPAGTAIFDLIRREQEAARELEEDEFVLQGPPGMPMYRDIDEGEHRPHADGYFHLKRRHALPLLNAVGWKQIRTPGR